MDARKQQESKEGQGDEESDGAQTGKSPQKGDRSAEQARAWRYEHEHYDSNEQPTSD